VTTFSTVSSTTLVTSTTCGGTRHNQVSSSPPQGRAFSAGGRKPLGSATTSFAGFSCSWHSTSLFFVLIVPDGPENLKCLRTDVSSSNHLLSTIQVATYSSAGRLLEVESIRCCDLAALGSMSMRVATRH